MTDFNTPSLPEYVHSLNHQHHTAPIYHKIQQGAFNTLFIAFLIWHARVGHGRLSITSLKSLIESCESWHAGIVTVLSKLARSLDLANLDTELPKETRKLSEFAFKAELDMLAKHLTFDTIKNRSNKQKITDSCQNIVKFINLKSTRFDLNEKKDILELLNFSFTTEDHMSLEQQLNNALKNAKIKLSSTRQLTLADL
jgi:hypothetical protein